MRRALLLSLCAAGLAPAVVAQGVPFGDHIASRFTASTTTADLFLVDRTTNTCKDITGLTATNVEAVQIDEVNKSIWLGSRAGGFNLHVITLGTNCDVVSEVAMRNILCGGGAGGITGIAMSANRKPTVLRGWCVWEVERDGSALTLLFNARQSGISSGQCEGIAKDPRNGDLYFGLNGATSTAGIYRLQRGPNCTYLPAVRLGSIQPASPSVSIQGLDVCPTTGDVYWISRTTNGNNVGRMPTSGASMGIPTSAGWGPPASYNWIEYDRQNDDFVLVEDARGGFTTNNVISASKAFATSTICTAAASGTTDMTSIDTSDCAVASTNIAPVCPPTGVPFNFEIGTCCPPGQTAGIFLVAPVAVSVALGPVDATGRLDTSFTLTVPAGLPPGFLVFASVCFNPANGRLTIGTPTTWPSP